MNEGAKGSITGGKGRDEEERRRTEGEKRRRGKYPELCGHLLCDSG